MSDSNKEEEPTLNTESEMEVEDKRAERKEEKENNTKTCIFITIIVILAVVSIGLLIALIIVAVKNNNDSNSSSSPLEYTELYVSNEKKGKGDCISIDRACDSLTKAYKKINAEGDYKIYVISDTLNPETEEIVIENSVTITKPSTSSLSNQETSTSINVCDIDKEGDKKSLFSMSYKSRALNINYLSFLLEKDALKPSKPVISMGGGSLSLLSCSFGRVDEASDVLSSCVIDITSGNCAINSCSFTNIQREEGNGGAISAILSAGSTLEISSTVLNGCTSNKGNGGAIYTVDEYGSSLTLKKVEFTACQSIEGDGGAMYSEVKDGAKMVIGENEGEECSFKSCKAGSEDALMKGGGLYVKINNSKNILINNVIFGKEEGELNEALNGKGIFLEVDEWNENTITAMFPVVSKEGKDNRDILEGMKINEGEESEIIDLYTAAYANGDKDNLFSLSIEVNQIGESNKLKVKWETDKSIDEIKVEIVRGDKVSYSYISSDDAVIRFRRSINLEGIYGRERVRVTARRSSYSEMQSMEINVTASNYIIAPLVATMPVTYFSLKMKEFTNEYTIPVIIWMERYEAYDWTSLPNNFFLIPTFADGEIDTKALATGYQRTAEYVKELHEANPKSTFELYINDLHVYGAVWIVYANNLSSLFKIHMITDGFGSQQPLNYIVNDSSSTPEDKLEKASNEWITFRNSVVLNNKVDSAADGYIAYWDLRVYCVAIMDVEPNVDWTILNELRRYVDSNKVSWFDKYTTSDPQRLTNDSLSNIFKYEITDAEKEVIKNIFHMSSFFEEAEQKHKKIHCIIGTSSGEENLEYLMKCVQKLGGDEYILYYKGHPGTPTPKNSTKVAMLEKNGITDVDSTIPFELIYFYNGQMTASGYQSGSFEAFKNNGNYLSENFFALFEQRKTTALGSGKPKYIQSFKYFIKGIKDSDTDVQNYKRGAHPILVEYNEDNKIAIYNPDDDTLKYYKPNSSGTGYDEIVQ